MKKPSVLVVDDMLPILELMKLTIPKDKYDLTLTSSLKKAKFLCNIIQFDYVITDLNLQFEDKLGGFDLIQYLIHINFLGKIGIMSGYHIKIPEQLKSKISFIFTKPFSMKNFLKEIEGS